MIYEMEELIPLTAKLAEKYTSKESSSVTYERARELMSAILYCLHEWETGEDGVDLPAAGEGAVPLGEIYERGYQLVLKKAFRAKVVYEQLIRDFEDYGCENYRDTIIKGMPAFFTRYDARFEPGDHILLLDYPLAVMPEGICGVDLIYEYLQGIQLEKTFLDCFPAETIRKVLERVEPHYQKSYMGNICEPVLFYTVMCVLLGYPLEQLEIPEGEILRFFRGESLESIDRKLTGWIRVTAEKMAGIEPGSKLEHLGRVFAVRIDAILDEI